MWPVVTDVLIFPGRMRVCNGVPVCLLAVHEPFEMPPWKYTAQIFKELCVHLVIKALNLADM